MDRYAIINEDGVVTNICNWDGVTPWSPPEGSIAIKSNEAEINDTYKDGVFTHPEPVAVPEISIKNQIVSLQEQLDELIAKVQ
jgi:hypothetical protein